MLHLAAADETDLEIISVQMQDAALRREDMRFEAKRHRFSLAANRFAWDALPTQQRRRSALRFDDVLSVQAQGMEVARADTVLSLLAISFAKIEALAGVITLTFSSAISIRLHVSCINVALDDLGGVWATASVPSHEV